MKIKGMIKTLVCAFGLVTAGSAMAGDIYEILPCNRAGETIEAPASLTEPLQSGETVYFKIRFAKRNLADATAKAWYLDHRGIGSEVVDDALFPLQIGVYAAGKASGMPDFADLVDWKETDGGRQTDFIFAYKTKVGDFALPIVLAVKDGDTVRPSTESEEATSYYFNRTDKWVITNGVESEPVDFRFRASDPLVGSLTSDSLNHVRARDYSLSKCGFYVQTIDFDNNWENKTMGTELWRSVHQNSTVTVGATPQIVALAPLDDAVTMYVWSTEDEAVTINGGTLKEMITGYTDGVAEKKTVRVGRITMAGGRSVADFSIYGVTEGRTADLILSSRDVYRYTAGTKERFVDYVSVPVKCIEPQPASVVVETDRTRCYASGNYMVSVARLSVSLTQPYADGPLEVTLNPKFEDGTDASEWGNYIRFSTSSDQVSTLPPPDVLPKVTIPAGSTAKVPVWVYALRADSHTVGTGHQIQFFPTISPEAEAAAGIHDFVPTGMEIIAEKPVIVTPDTMSEYAVTASENLEITVAVDDTYADLTDTATGYKVQIKTSSTASWVTLDENFKASGEGGELVGLTSGKAPEITYPVAGQQRSQIRVVSPISGKTSDIVTFTVNVAAAKTTKAYTTDDKGDEYVEGDIVHFGVELSAPNDTNKPIYAFLLCNEDVDLTQFGGTAGRAIILDRDAIATRSQGIQISSVGQSATSSFTVLDGMAEEDGGQNYTFQVVLCDQKVYDPAHRLPGYPTTEMLNITVYNKAPTIDDVQVGGFASDGNGSTFTTQYPKGQLQEIQPLFTDVAYDLKHGFNYKWTASRNGQGIWNGVVKHDLPADQGGVTEITTSVSGKTTTTLVPDGMDINLVPFTYGFPQSGNWSIKVQAMDKDMGGKYAPLAFTVNMTVIDNPQVKIDVASGYLESDNKAFVTVGLGYWDGVNAPEALVVKVTLTPPAGVNSGKLELDSAFKAVPAGYPALAENEYYVSFSEAVDQQIHIDTMDGTPLTSSKGYTIRAEVVTGGASTDPAKEWFEYYLPAQDRVYIENEMPITVVTTPPDSTNGWQVAGGAATSYPISWQIRKDVDADFTTTWEHGEGPGIKVEITGCDNAETKYITNTDVWSGKFIPNFGTAQGTQTVILTIEDKDGDYETWTYTYEIISSKFLMTTSTGPSAGSTSSKLSQRYAKADGRGAGHTYVSGAMYAGAEAFTRSWNCQRENSVMVYGYGYKWGAIDNGTLNGGFNVAVDKQGNNATGAKTLADDVAYVYDLVDADDEGNELKRDSFFYCWLLTEAGEQNARMVTSVLGGTAAPEIYGTPAKGTVDLPKEALQDDSYPRTYLEAIFSKEWKVEDNAGDINFDGIPDIFAFRTWRGGNLIDLVAGADDQESEDGQSPRMDNDMIDLAATNPDEDYLPGVLVSAGISPLVPKSANSYAPIGIPLTTIREIRGWDEDGLNATDIVKSEIKFTTDEMSAWKAYAEEKGLDPDEPNLAVWSPEPGSVDFPRMDPTMADTDGDGFDDGWEFYFWYAAKVLVYHEPIDDVEKEATLGYKPRYGQVHAFERFDPLNQGIIEGIEIPASEVLEYFDPCRKRTAQQLKERPDFDNDGLSDYEEYLLGTNPTHWDTDGDHLCDAWEVMMCLDPLNGFTNKGNPDKDFMAMVTTDGCAAFHLEGEEGEPVQKYAIDVRNELKEGLDIFNGTALRDLTFKGIVCSTFADPRHPEVPYTYGIASEVPAGMVIEDGRADSKVYGYWMAKEYSYEEITIPAGTEVTTANFVFIHDQVYDLFGFDPRTAWNKTDFGFVGDRWDPRVNPAIAGDDETGVAVDTVPYSTYDEYLVMRYRLDFEKNYGDQKLDFQKLTVWDLMRAMTTNPNVVTVAEDEEEAEVPADTTGEENGEPVAEKGPSEAYKISQAVAKAFAAAGSTKAPILGHGADTDGDGIPDGWELYTFHSPTSALTAAVDEDADTLTRVAEYAGTDSCAAYEGCPSIYKNHPSRTNGWLNKFFPTDPKNADTDGDGIKDGAEGGSFGTTFKQTNGAVIPCAVSFIYGAEDDKPVDDGSCCIRGGGLNPCTVDTDLDGLPDGWEASYGGITVNPSTRQAVHVLNEHLEPLMAEIGADRWIADGLGAEGGPNVVYIMGGQDPTWAGDAYTDPNTPDSLLGEKVYRDVDWDHDGLQNYQEYLVQTIRHFRYDDTTTPLMGRTMKEFGNGAQHRMDFAGFVPMMQDAEQFSVAAVLAWEGREFLVEKVTTNDFRVITNEFTQVVSTNWIVNVTTNILDSEEWVNSFRRPGEDESMNFRCAWSAAGWKALGYMAEPVHEWDRMITAHKITPRLLYPVRGCGQYLGTSPINWDTDGDGMDDYYELFHGLNPLLGSELVMSQDVIANAYGYPGLYNAALNEWTHPDFNRAAVLGFGLPGSVNPPLNPPALLDPVMYPWMMGAMEVDADGDGVNNANEAPLANVADPTSMHTDPSPLWFTDTSSAKSYVSQYYRNTYPVSLLPFWPTALPFDKYADASVMGANGDAYLFAFEENEGYDTDNDWIPDGLEASGAATKQADPRDFSDPNRRQAMYFDGVDSFMMTAQRQNKAADGQDMLKQFTVECWVKPEAFGKEQTIIDRSSFYPGDKINDLAGAVRSNFRIAIDPEGLVYGLFDGTEAIESGTSDNSTARVNGSILEPNEWAHVAFTYDGKRLAIYVNGSQVGAKENVSLIPANGVLRVFQDITGTSTFPSESFRTLRSALFLGARPQHFEGYENLERRQAGLTPYYPVSRPYDANQEHLESFENYREYFQGWIDEVRIWDGARTTKQIVENYTKRFSFKDVSALRDANYDEWLTGATRSYTDGRPMMSPELIAHYNFCNMPGGIAPEFVASAPSGFRKFVLGAASAQYVDNADNDGGYWSTIGMKGVDGSRDLVDGVNIAWWKDCLTHSKVYTDYSVIPWTENTVNHLPPMDGSSPDSLYYGTKLAAGYTLPSVHENVSSFSFPNNANPYADPVYTLESWRTLFQRKHFADQDTTGVASNLYSRYNYQLHNSWVGNSNLLPMGGAYARTTSEYWDGSPSDTWEISADEMGHEDDDCDGLPDWWEELVKGELGDGLNWNSTVTYMNAQMTAGQAFQIQIAQGLQPDGAFHEEFKASVDDNHNGLPDWWEEVFSVQGGANDDPDGDGLSNYAEYVLSMCFDLGSLFDPNKSHTFNSKDSDYFFPIGAMYVGEIFTDNDMIDDKWEDTLDDTVATRYRWDRLTDGDENGWTAWDEACAYHDDGTWVTIAYETNKVSRTFDGRTQLGYADWVNWWTTNTFEILEANVSWYQDAGSPTPWLQKNLLRYDRNGHRLTEIEEEGYPQHNVVSTYTVKEIVPIRAYIGRPNPLLKAKFWYNGQRKVTVSDGENGNNGGDDEEVTEAYAPIVITTFTDRQAVQPGSEYSEARLVVPDATYVVTPTTSILAQPLEFTLDKPTKGFLKGGKNTVVAILDLDGDGVYTPGEPMGVMRDVEIGWHQGAFQMELTDVSPIITRALLTSVTSSTGDVNESEVSSDRYILYGNEDGDFRDLVPGSLSGGAYQRFRVIRTLANDIPVVKGASNRVVADNWVNLDQRPYFFEGDVMRANEFDLDWTFFDEITKQLPKEDITNVTYRIVLGNGDISPEGTNNLFSIATTRHFDATALRPKPVAIAPGKEENSVVYGPRPTFKWSLGQYNTYTAFRIQVRDAANTVVWDSGLHMAPARDSKGRYTYEGDVYAGDQLEPGVNYKWRVSMYNAKFKTDLWSDDAYFRMEPITEGVGYDKIDVCVKYFGPALNGGTLRVEAFETPDFTGLPAARTFVEDTSDVDTYGAKHEAIATLAGLRNGTYYVRAYLDSKTYGKRNVCDDWESSGYVCAREADRAKPFIPAEITVADDLSSGRVVTVYVEDADKNGNNIPDAYEMAKNGGKLDNGAQNVTTTLAEGIVLNEALATILRREGAQGSALSTFVMTSLAQEAFAEMALGIKVTAQGGVSGTLMGGTEVVADSVAITGAVFDPAAGTVKLTVGADVANPYDSGIGASLYTFTTDTTTVTCKVLRKASLAQANWEVVATKVITVGRDQTEVVAELGESVDGAGFFKVELEK